jgi:hypothetical protein
MNSSLSLSLSPILHSSLLTNSQFLFPPPRTFDTSLPLALLVSYEAQCAEGSPEEEQKEAHLYPSPPPLIPSVQRIILQDSGVVDKGDVSAFKLVDHLGAKGVSG